MRLVRVRPAARSRVVPHADRIRNVSLNVAVAVVLEAQAKGLASHPLGMDEAAVRAKLSALMWSPGEGAPGGNVATLSA